MILAFCAGAAPASQPTTVPFDTPIKQVQLKQVDFEQAIDFLRQRGPLNIYTEWNALRAFNISRRTRVSCESDSITPRSAIEQILKPFVDGTSAISCAIMGDVVVLSSTDGLADALGAYHVDELKMADPEARKILEQRIAELKFERTPLTDVIDWLISNTKAKITVDWRSLAAAGVARNTAVTVRVKDVPLVQALRLILHDAGGRVLIDYTVDQGAINLFAAPQ
jgi:hypothetical protein